MLVSWLKIFFRNFKKSPLYPLINLFGLIAGITCFLLAMLYVSNEFSYEKWNPDAENTFVSLTITNDGQMIHAAPCPLPYSAVESFPELTDFMLVRHRDDYLIKHENNAFYGHTIFATENFFSFFPFPFKFGTAENCLSQKDDIVISEELSNKLFGQEDPIGKIVQYQNEESLTIKGVFQTDGYPSHLVGTDIIKPFDEDLKNGSWGNFNYTTYYKTIDNFDAISFREKFTNYYMEKGAAVEKKSLEDYKKYFTLTVGMENILDLHLFSIADKGKGASTVFILSLLSFLILIISAINFINLSISGATLRAKEVAVRKSMGSGKVELVLQFVMEVVILCVIAFLVSLAIVEILLPQFGNLLDRKLSIINVMNDLPVLLLTILGLITFAGLFPALYLSNFNPVKVLKGNFSRSKSGSILKKTMIIIQFAISAIFLISAFIVNAQLDYMNNKDLGFDKEHMLIVEVNDPEKLADKNEFLQEELAKLKGVKSVFYTDRPPGTESNNGSKTKFYYQEEPIALTDIHLVDTDFFTSMDIAILEGRNFHSTEKFDTVLNKVLINESIVKKWNIENPIGKIIEFWDVKCEIIGIVEDYLAKGFEEEAYPAVYSIGDEPRKIMMKLQSENLQNTISQIEDFWVDEIEPGFPFQYEFLDANFAKLYLEHVRLRKLVTALSIIMIIISLLGLFAVASHTIQQRYKEVAIRKTIGASETGLIMNLVKDFLIICITAIFFALPIAYLLSNRWLQDFTTRIDMPIVPYFVAPLIILGLTILIVLLQARKALNVDLVKYLKYE